MLKDNRIIKRYSESFKLKVLHEISQGKLTKNEIFRVYDISPGSLEAWIRKYGGLDLFNKRIKIETMDDIEKLKKVEEENKKLRELLVQKEIDGLMSEAYLEYAAKQLGYKSVDEF